MTYHRLFMDETELNHEQYYFLLGLCCSQTNYDHWEGEYKALKSTLAADGIITHAHAEFHLHAIKQHQGAFAPLGKPANRQQFWTQLTSFVDRMPFHLTSVLVSNDHVKKASLVDWRLTVKLTAMRTLLENATAIASTIDADRYLLSHDWLDSEDYKASVKQLIKNLPSTGLRLVPANDAVIRELFDENIEWVPKDQRNMGIELADLMANPILIDSLKKTPGKEVPLRFRHAAWEHFAVFDPEYDYNPFAVRWIP